MKSVRNYHPAFKAGLIPGTLYSGLSAFILKGREPWTFHNDKPDSAKVWILSPMGTKALRVLSCFPCSRVAYFCPVLLVDVSLSIT